MAEVDPDVYRDGIVCGDLADPSPMLAARREAPTLRPDQLVAALRERAARLWRRLAELAPDDPPQTLRDVEDDQLEALCRQLERRIAEARRR